jgi:beta-glucosidase
MGTVGSTLHRQTARQAVRKSLVLLKNTNALLPLRKDYRTIYVGGRLADDIGAQCGGWTISWQGANGPVTPGTSVLQAIQNVALPTTRITYDPEITHWNGEHVGVLVLGESPYAEGEGDRTDLRLSRQDVQAFNALKATGMPFVVILLSGRPLIIDEIVDRCDALIAAWLPGTEGDGIADVLFGDASPSGTLSHSWPRSMSQIPMNAGDTPYDPLFPYGFGLGY